MMTLDIKQLVEQLKGKYPILVYDKDSVIADHKLLFLMGGSQRLVIEGQTPSWNDGEVCNHREIVLDEITARDEYGFDDEDDLTAEMACPPIGNCDPEIRRIISSLRHTRVNLYKTDYRIVLERLTDDTASYAIEGWNSEW